MYLQYLIVTITKSITSCRVTKTDTFLVLLNWGAFLRTCLVLYAPLTIAFARLGNVEEQRLLCTLGLGR